MVSAKIVLTILGSKISRHVVQTNANYEKNLTVMGHVQLVQIIQELPLTKRNAPVTHVLNVKSCCQLDIVKNAYLTKQLIQLMTKCVLRRNAAQPKK